MNKISNYTEQILNKLPYWFKMKKKPKESIGASFLNVVGLEFDDMRSILEYAFKQTYLNTMDTNYLNYAFKAYIPDEIRDISSIKVKSSFCELKEVYDLTDFFNITFDYYENKSNYDDDICLIDYEKEIIYVKKEYDVSDNFKFGKLTVVDSFGNEYVVELSTHAVWNYFDEIGLLIDCPRLENETNFDYKERLVDVFRYKRGSDRDGLANAIASELNLRKHCIWKSADEDFIIKDKMVILNRIKVNDEYVDVDDIFLNIYGDVVISKSAYDGVNLSVCYEYGFEMHQLHNKNDKKLYSELINLDKTATKLLDTYFNKIHSISPIVWDKFIWDKSYWNVSDKYVGGMAFIPNLTDGKIEGFKKYLK